MCGHIIYVNKFSTDIDSFEEVAMNESLSKTDLRVFLFLCCRIGSKHITKIDKDKIAESLGISKKKVNESIQNLITNCIITNDCDDHVKSGYRMSYTEYVE